MLLPKSHQLLDWERSYHQVLESIPLCLRQRRTTLSTNPELGRYQNFDRAHRIIRDPILRGLEETVCSAVRNETADGEGRLMLTHR